MQPISSAPHGRVVWLTGLSAAGKTTIAKALEARLVGRLIRARVLDGDELRRTVCSDLGFSATDRADNVRRAARLAASTADEGSICIVALISPLRAHREEARRIIGAHRFIEVHVATPLDVCRKRDPKGLYARADRGEIREFTGISAPYERPVQPDVVLHTERLGIDGCVECIVAKLNGRTPDPARLNPQDQIRPS